MQQAKFSLSEPLLEFLSHYRQYGYKDKSAMVQAALLRMQQEYETNQLRESAALYAEVYIEDAELRELTDRAMSGWPE
jgi:metal-responsive CopG/Arc/MetJ family transcriptional regulator